MPPRGIALAMTIMTHQMDTERKAPVEIVGIPQPRFSSARGYYHALGTANAKGRRPTVVPVRRAGLDRTARTGFVPLVRRGSSIQRVQTWPMCLTRRNAVIREFVIERAASVSASLGSQALPATA